MFESKCRLLMYENRTRTLRSEVTARTGKLVQGPAARGNDAQGAEQRKDTRPSVWIKPPTNRPKEDVPSISRASSPREFGDTGPSSLGKTSGRWSQTRRTSNHSSSKRETKAIQRQWNLFLPLRDSSPNSKLSTRVRNRLERSRNIAMYDEVICLNRMRFVPECILWVCRQETWTACISNGAQQAETGRHA